MARDSATTINMKPSSKSSARSGFTLIEVLVMTSLAVIIMLSAVILLMTFLLNQTRITQRQKIRTEGDNALKQMVQVLREAKELAECDGEEKDEITYQDVYNLEGRFTITTDEESIPRISLTNHLEETIYLTSQDLHATNFNATCTYNETEGSYFINFNFELVNIKAPRFAEDPLSQTFEASVSLRN